MNRIIKPNVDVVSLPKRAFNEIADRVLKIEEQGFKKPERWDSESYEDGIKSFREVYNLPFARSFGAYAEGSRNPEDLLGYTIVMPVEIAREQFVNDDGTPSDEFHRVSKRNEDKNKYVWTFDVDKSFQKQGIGTQIMDRVVEEARRDGAHSLYFNFRVKPRDRFAGRKCNPPLAVIDNYADTGVTYFLQRMRI